VGAKESVCKSCIPNYHKLCPPHLIIHCGICFERRFQWKTEVGVRGRTAEEAIARYSKKYGEVGYKQNLRLHSGCDSYERASSKRWVFRAHYCEFCFHVTGDKASRTMRMG
jgi:hypothetical protein